MSEGTTNGNVTEPTLLQPSVELSSVGNESNTSVVRSPGDGDTRRPLAPVLPAPIAAICALTLSTGIVSALLFFEYLCFTHPDAANIVIPLIMAPVMSYLNARWRERKETAK